MRRACVVLLTILLAISQTGCATLRRWTKRKPKAVPESVANSRRPLQLVGVIALVNEADGFVLIDSGSNPTPLTGARLLSYTGPAQSAQLKASVVRRRPFVVADILDGEPRKGDEIFEASTGVAVAVKQ
jgi:hypothetical protein